MKPALNAFVQELLDEIRYAAIADEKGMEAVVELRDLERLILKAWDKAFGLI